MIPNTKDIPKSHTIWQIREETYRKIILTNFFELHIIEIPKALEEYKKNPTDAVLQWMMFLDNPEQNEKKKEKSISSF